MTVKNPKYYYFLENKGVYVISKNINGLQTYLGYYKTEKAAKLAVELYKKYGWDKKNNWKIKAEVKEILKKEEKVHGSS